MSSEEDRNGKDIDELEMFESLDDSDVVLDTFTIEKKTKVSDFYHVNPTISYILFAVLGRIGIFFLAEYGYGSLRKADTGTGLIDSRDKIFVICMFLVSFMAYAAVLALLARKNIAESYFRSTGHEFPVFKAAIVYFLPGELIYLVVSTVPNGIFRFGMYTSLPLYYTYCEHYVFPNGRWDDIFGHYFYIKEDYIEFFKIFGIYELICFAVFFTTFKLAYNRAFCRKMHDTAYNKLEYASIVFACGIILAPLMSVCKKKGIENDLIPVLIALYFLLPILYSYYRAKKSYYWTFSGYDSKEGTAKKLLSLILPGEIMRAFLTFVVYNFYNSCRFGRIFAYPANVFFNAVYGSFVGRVNPFLDYFVFIICYMAYVAVNFGVMYVAAKKADLNIFKAYKEKLEKLEKL